MRLLDKISEGAEPEAKKKPRISRIGAYGYGICTGLGIAVAVLIWTMFS